jgi:hypothetical protein
VFIRPGKYGDFACEVRGGADQVADVHAADQGRTQEVVLNKKRRRCQRRSWCTERVEPAHFDWHWRERPALALLAWAACSRSGNEATPYPDGVNWLVGRMSASVMAYELVARNASVQITPAHLGLHREWLALPLLRRRCRI